MLIAPPSGKRGQLAVFFGLLWIGLGLTALFTGVYTYANYDGKQSDPPKIDDSFYKTLQLFYLKGDAPKNPDALPGAQAWYNVARFTGTSLLFFPVIAVGFGMIVSAWHAFCLHWWVGLWKLRQLFADRHIVIVGAGDHGIRFVEMYRTADPTSPDPLRRKKRTVVLIEIDPENPHILAARDAGAYIVIGDATDASRLNAAYIHNAERVIVQTSSDRVDMQVVAQIEQVLAARKGITPAQLKKRIDRSDPEMAARFACRKVPVSVMLSDTEILRGLQLAALQRGNLTLLERSHFSVRDLTARAVVRQIEKEYRELAAKPNRPAAPPRVLLFGYGAFGEELLEALAAWWGREGDAATRLPLPVVVIDRPDPTAAKKADVNRDLVNLPYLGAGGGLLAVRHVNSDLRTLLRLDEDDAATAAEFAAVREADIAVLTEESPDEALRLGIHATELRHKFDTQYTMICLLNQDLAGELHRNSRDGAELILPFDIEHEVLNRTNLESGQMIEQIAEKMAGNYAGAYAPDVAPWRWWFVRLFRRSPKLLPSPFPVGDWATLTDGDRAFWRRRAEVFVQALEASGFRVQRRQSIRTLSTFDTIDAAHLAEAVSKLAGAPLAAGWQTAHGGAAILAAVGKWPAILLDYGFEVVRPQSRVAKTTYTLYPNEAAAK